MTNQFKQMPVPGYPGKRIKGAESLIKAAALQMEPCIGDKENNIFKSVSLINKACENGVQLMVLPELCNTGYMFNSREEAFALSETVPDGPSCAAWIECCEKYDAYIVAGITERENNLLYDSAVVLGPEGHIGTYRKVHLWNEEKLWFEPGNLGFPVFDLPFGRIGCRIC